MCFASGRGELPCEGMHELCCGGCNGCIHGPFPGMYWESLAPNSAMMQTDSVWVWYWKIIVTFQSSIAPHHTTHQMTTKETLLDMRRKFFYNTCQIFVYHSSMYSVKQLCDILISTGTIVSSARSFAMVGFMIVGIECIIETHRSRLSYQASLSEAMV